MSSKVIARTRPVTVYAAAGVDIVIVIAFAVIGRVTHGSTQPLTVLPRIAWPFLVGLAVGWLVVQGWKRPLAVVPTGVVIWLCTWGVAMLLRAVTGAGTALPFIVASGGFMALTLIGWRLLVRLSWPRR